MNDNLRILEVILVMVIISGLIGFASASNLRALSPNTLIKATLAKTTSTTLKSTTSTLRTTSTTTSTIRQIDTSNLVPAADTLNIIRCEAVTFPSEDKCGTGTCPTGYECDYSPSTTAANTGVCRCKKVSSAPMPPNRCEQIDASGEGTCRPGICITGQQCRYFPSASAANRGTCRCVGTPTTTTTQEYTWCSDISNPNQRTCQSGLCPPNTVCRLKTDLVRAGFNPSSSGIPESSGVYSADSFFDISSTIDIDPADTGCACVPCGPKTTTRTLPQRCESVSEPSERMCMAGVCPINTRCTYKAGVTSVATLAAVVSPGSCECVGGTTTTLPTRCEAIDDAGSRQCVEGLCPPEYNCRYVPSLTAANQGNCRCIPPTTTTIPQDSRCEELDATGAQVCTRGVCPPDYDCRFIQSLAAANVGSCRCIPPTTTTIPQDERCEAIDDAGAQQCVEGLCPPELDCRYIPSLAAANIGSCRCVSPVTTSTLAQNVRCERIDDANERTCELGICPPDKNCEVIRYTLGNTQVSNCICVDEYPSTTTTRPGDVKCEGIDGASEATCSVGLCPPNTKCKVIKYNFGSTQVANCLCVEGETTTTTIPDEVKCEAITKAGEKECRFGLCPPKSVCISQTDDSGAIRCGCIQTTTATLGGTPGFFSRVWSSLFG